MIKRYIQSVSAPKHAATASEIEVLRQAIAEQNKRINLQESKIVQLQERLAKTNATVEVLRSRRALDNAPAVVDADFSVTISEKPQTIAEPTSKRGRPAKTAQNDAPLLGAEVA